MVAFRGVGVNIGGDQHRTCDLQNRTSIVAAGSSAASVIGAALCYVSPRIDRRRWLNRGTLCTSAAPHCAHTRALLRKRRAFAAPRIITRHAPRCAPFTAMARICAARTATARLARPWRWRKRAARISRKKKKKKPGRRCLTAICAFFAAASRHSRHVVIFVGRAPVGAWDVCVSAWWQHQAFGFLDDNLWRIATARICVSKPERDHRDGENRTLPYHCCMAARRHRA